MTRTVENGISPTRRYQISMLDEDETQVERIVILPIGLANNPATVEIWYQKYVPEKHLIVDIEPVEATEEPVVEEQYVGFGDSLEYVGEDEPTEDTSEDEQDISEEEYLRRTKNGGTFVAGSEDSPKEGG